LGVSGDRDATAMMQAVMEGTHQHEVDQFGGSAVLPVPDVVGVQPAGGPAPGDHAAAVAVLQCPTESAADGAGDPPGPDDLALAFEPGLTGGITEQVLAVAG
jgi:hypothetical protein